jgi:hypothetical protein
VDELEDDSELDDEDEEYDTSLETRSPTSKRRQGTRNAPRKRRRLDEVVS